MTAQIPGNQIDVNNTPSIKRTLQSLETYFGNFYTKSKNLAENGMLSKPEVIELQGDFSGIQDVNFFFQILWDSLVYQVLIQEDFYVKEALIQILQLMHYIEHYNSVSDEIDSKKKAEKLQTFATAKVVLPEELFVDSISAGSSDVVPPIVAKLPNGTFPLEVQNLSADFKKQELLQAVYGKNALEKLKKELQKLQKKYTADYAKSYDAAYKRYQQNIKPLLEVYENAILVVEANFTEETTDAQKRLALNNVPKPTIEEFAYNAQPERDLTVFQQKLSSESLNTFAAFFGIYMESSEVSSKAISRDNVLDLETISAVFPEDEYLTFDDILNEINNKISEANDAIYTNTEIKKMEFASVGGVLIPIGSNGDTSNNKTFSISTIGIDYENWFVLISLDDRTLDIVSAEYTAHGLNNASVSDNSGQKTSLGAGTFEIFNDNIHIPAHNFTGDSFTINAEFVLSDGNTYTTEIVMNRTIKNGNNLPDYYTQQYNFVGRNVLSPQSPVQVSTSSDFTPSGSGIKRLGIADYLKVEQSTHAYVEGEVANIENIMAREYREKSTRRLRRSEITETESSDTEREQLTDTTTASRFEMQSEISKILQEATDMGVSANTHVSLGVKGNSYFDIGASYANHRSKEDSMRQAVTQAQDITARALDRVVSKVHKERIEKIIEEFEENNIHGFDNKKGDKHVVGVYRWVDKLMKNQVWNYGKRLMFEFAIPQPAKLHMLAMNSMDKKVIEKPIDPRDPGSFSMPDYTALSNDNVLKHWASVYNVEIDDKPKDSFKIGKSLSGDYTIIYSSVTEDELLNAPKRVKEFLENIPSNLKKRVELTEEAVKLADTYIAEKVVGKTSREDCLHIALATINKADILVSWNFKHIVNVFRIRGYNAVNLKSGYTQIDIRSPKDIINYEK
ncbi:MAG: hypothetical protein LBE36_02235 [Flavobacteriaceae bacterium]|nr:hypothetical protein [Flavobacteriaceae bacterium]